MHHLAMLNGWEIVLVVSVAVVLLAVRSGFNPEAAMRDGKKAVFYLLMTAGAIVVGCLLAVVVARVME